ncbi:hypothetical protein LWC34_46395 [Kibdelosporangium philippinense]|uniref:Uncharacterized protein n=2 Tax=Kibdelosporangium philippinense TaxID=211113 RepID=A0ABS8ZR14_9PSEU|nr:hypothetical protein [Kibdelosporangium philippinense]
MDELDLVKQLKDVPPLRPEAYERARATLGTAMAQTQTLQRPDAAVLSRKWFSLARLGIKGRIGIGVAGAVAAGAAVVMVASTSVPTPAPTEATAQEAVVEAPLMKLATSIKASGGQLPGDASLVIRSTTAPDGKPYVVYSLYTDKGAVFFAESKKDLPGAVSRGADLADPSDARTLAAARAAASGDLDKARVQMVNATKNVWGLDLSPAEQQKIWDAAQAETMKLLKEKGVANPQPKPRPTGKALEEAISNNVRTNATNALFLGAANPEVRAGVLRLISSISDVKVDKSTVKDRPTLVITAGPSVFGGHSEGILTIDAETGLPLRSDTKPAPKSDGPAAVATYDSKRVTVADVVAGKF